MKQNIFMYKFKKDPLGFIKRSFYKIFVGPFKYGKGNDYEAQKYWEDRFSKYGHSFKGAGDEGLSENENKKMYKEAAKKLRSILSREKLDIKNIKVLEVGCGSGFYTKLLHDLGVKNYLGIDITDILFVTLKRKFPEYKFVKSDVTLDKVYGKFDLIIMIDVVEHIVKDDKFITAMGNIKSNLSENGVFIITPISNKGKKHLFYVRSWSIKELKKGFTGYSIGKLTPFRDGNVVVIRNK